MAKKKLFGNNIKPSCKYCELGIAGEGDKIHCSKMGDVKAYDSCKKFVYPTLHAWGFLCKNLRFYGKLLNYLLPNA